MHFNSSIIFSVGNEFERFATGSTETAAKAPDWGEVRPPEPADGLST